MFVYCCPEIANFKHAEVNELGRLYLDVTCRFTLYWAFGDALDTWLAVLRHFNIINYGIIPNFTDGNCSVFGK